MIAGMTYYEICFYFLFYSVAGWVIEVVYHAVRLGKVVNRGFLNGPVCPVYGFGALAVFAVSNLIGDFGGRAAETPKESIGSLLLLFLCGTLLATAVELIAGWALDRLFHTRWWDYSDQTFNFHGYICLRFSLIWGLAVVFVVSVIQPLIKQKTDAGIPEEIGWPVMIVCYVLYLTDFGVTVSTIIGLNKKLEELDSIRGVLRKPSDKLSETIGTGTIRASQKIGEAQVQAALGKAELKDTVNEKRMTSSLESAKKKADLQLRYQELKKKILSGKFFGTERILRAFPKMENREHKELLKELMKHLDEDD